LTRYVDLRAVHRLIGANYPFGVPSLVESLESYLGVLKQSGDSLPERLLEHNISGSRRRAVSEFAAVDADLLFTVETDARKLNMELKDYRVHQQFARPIGERRVVLHILMIYPNRTCWNVSIPLQALMKGFGDPEEDYQCYSHSISRQDPDTSRFMQNYYCGITSRNWLKRMAEHFAEVRGGSNRTFHRAWSEYQGRADVYLSSELVALNHSFEAAMAWEEFIVDRHIAGGCSLNMIPGGFKGLKLLHTLGHLNRTSQITLEERERAIAEFAKRHPRAKVPNLLIAGLWADDAYYAKVITGRSNTLSLEQVRRIRILKLQGATGEAIAANVGARSVEQVNRVLSGRTYRRLR
jgi:hypothetical protein